MDILNWERQWLASDLSERNQLQYALNEKYSANLFDLPKV